MVSRINDELRERLVVDEFEEDMKAVSFKRERPKVMQGLLKKRTQELPTEMGRIYGLRTDQIVDEEFEPRQGDSRGRSDRTVIPEMLTHRRCELDEKASKIHEMIDSKQSEKGQIREELSDVSWRLDLMTEKERKRLSEPKFPWYDKQMFVHPPKLSLQRSDFSNPDKHMNALFATLPDQVGSYETERERFDAEMAWLTKPYHGEYGRKTLPPWQYESWDMIWDLLLEQVEKMLDHYLGSLTHGLEKTEIEKVTEKDRSRYGLFREAVVNERLIQLEMESILLEVTGILCQETGTSTLNLWRLASQFSTNLIVSATNESTGAENPAKSRRKTDALYSNLVHLKKLGTRLPQNLINYSPLRP